MTIDELKEFAACELDRAAGEMRKNGGDLHQHFVLMHAAGGVDLIVAGADVTNSESAKGALARRVRAHMAEAGDIVAVVMVSDTYIAWMTPEQARIQKSLGLTVEQAGKAGLCTVEEAITVTLESPIYAQTATQKYTRDGARIAFMGPPQILTSEEDAKGLSGKFFGRFMNFFDHAAEARP